MSINAKKIILSEAAKILRRFGHLDLAQNIDSIELPNVDGGPGIRILTFENGKIVDVGPTWFSLPYPVMDAKAGQTFEAVYTIPTERKAETHQVTSVSIDYTPGQK